MNKVVTGPEESWDPLIHLSPKDLSEFVSKKFQPKSKDNILMRVNCFSEATGSSYIEMGSTKIIAVVYGPREIPRKDDYDFKIANLNVEFRFTPFACFMQRREQTQRRDQNLDEKNISSVVQEALKPSIMLHKYPKSQIDLYLMCLESDVDEKYALSASICAASMALSNASIELYDMVSSFTYLASNLTVSYMPQLNQITSIYFSNQSLQTDVFYISSDLFKSNIKDAIENCKKIYSYMRFVLLNLSESVPMDT